MKARRLQLRRVAWGSFAGALLTMSPSTGAARCVFEPPNSATDIAAVIRQVRLSDSIDDKTWLYLTGTVVDGSISHDDRFAALMLMLSKASVTQRLDVLEQTAKWSDYAVRFPRSAESSALQYSVRIIGAQADWKKLAVESTPFRKSVLSILSGKVPLVSRDDNSIIDNFYNLVRDIRFSPEELSPVAEERVQSNFSGEELPLCLVAGLTMEARGRIRQLIVRSGIRSADCHLGAIAALGTVGDLDSLTDIVDLQDRIAVSDPYPDSPQVRQTLLGACQTAISRIRLQNPPEQLLAEIEAPVAGNPLNVNSRYWAIARACSLVNHQQVQLATQSLLQQLQHRVQTDEPEQAARIAFGAWSNIRRIATDERLLPPDEPPTTFRQMRDSKSSRPPGSS